MSDKIPNEPTRQVNAPADPKAVELDLCNFTRTQEAALFAYEQSSWVLKGDPVRPATLASAYAKSNGVLRTKMTMTAITNWADNVKDADINIDIAPYATSRFICTGPHIFTSNPGVTDPASTALQKTIVGHGLTPVSGFNPEVEALAYIDWWALFPVLGFLMANIDRYLLKAGHARTDQLSAFLQALEATYSPVNIGEDGVDHEAEHRIGERSDIFNFTGLQAAAAAQLCGIEAMPGNRANPPRLDTYKATVWIPEGFGGTAAVHALAVCLWLYTRVYPGASTPVFVGETGVGIIANTVLDQFIEGLDHVMGMLEALHASSDPALARMLYTQGLGGAIRVHSAYAEGGVLRKASRCAAVAPLQGLIWLFPAPVKALAGETSLLRDSPSAFLAHAGWLLLQHVLVLQQGLCQQGPIVVCTDVAPEDKADLKLLYEENGYSVTFRERVGDAQQIHVEDLLEERLSEDLVAKQLRVGLYALYGGSESTAAFSALVTSVKLSDAHARIVVDSNDRRVICGQLHAGVTVGRAYIDRFADPELAVACGLPVNHAAVLAGRHTASWSEVSEALLSGGDVRDNAVLTALAITDYRADECDQIRIGTVKRKDQYIQLFDGRFKRITRRGLQLSALGWHQHGRLPCYHSIAYPKLEGCTVLGAETMPETLKVNWVRGGGAAEVLRLINPRRASVVAAEKQ